VGEYVIIYRLENDDALILHVLRGGRDIEALLRQ
jgi:plasmid stabilization system protein ParE